MTVTTKTSAVLSIEASEAENKLQWALAADLYQQALDAYPAGLKGTRHDRDKTTLATRAKACRVSANRVSKK